LAGSTKAGAIGLLVVAWLLAGCGGNGDSSTTVANLPTITAPNLTTSGQTGAGGGTTTTATNGAPSSSQSSKAGSTTSTSSKPARKLPPGKRGKQSKQASPAEIRATCQSKVSQYPASQQAAALRDCLNPPDDSGASTLPPGKHE
jgi:hypothetical protein